ncbi:acyl-CoA dehydrogenase family protein [Plantactinospora sp. KLBMP9567]|uniref:acyl-CoA dehydrogenase family protein n=1 Tax=Plantactinospora sp. KLBMP9567 TaxID=3085900 RepID=UPI002982529D|nr:acyl-CoA dehydrogenase family protein [Plantactinospora sp. KLBMP9567]MDW5322271.1 acyl-CoA dehydrogenase family protein [Plantactinospora sp. KLBMP9567]
MDFGFDSHQSRLRARVRAVLATPGVRRAIDDLAAGTGEPDERPLYRAIGAAGVLAPDWPAEFGGLGGGPMSLAVVAEELSRAGVPDTLHINTVQIVGSVLRAIGTADQQQRWLPRFAAGERFACVLYTEPEAGSDLAALTTRAEPAPGGYLVSGTKIYSLKAALCDVALAAVRTGDSGSRYDGITLVLIDLHAPGVRVARIPSLADEHFHRVDLDAVFVPESDVLGEPGAGWAALTTALAMERTGLDYALKAARWYDTARAALTPGDAADSLADLGRHGARVDAARLLAWAALARLEEDRFDPVFAAMAKLHTSESAAAVAEWGAALHGAAAAPATGRARCLESAWREAPGLTISAGVSEVMLELIAGSLSGSAR